MRGPVRALAMLAAAAVPQAAVSAVPQTSDTGSILPSRAARMSERNIPEADRARQTMNDYASCLVNTRLNGVRKALGAGSDEEVGGAISRLAGPDRLDAGTSRMPAGSLRGAGYRALYIRDFGGEVGATLAPASAASA